MAATETQIKSDLKEMYDQLATEYSASYYNTAAGRYFLNRKIETMLQWITFSPGSHLLEVGCADGVYSLELANRGFTMTGLDLSPQCIQEATRQAKETGLEQAQFVVGDAENLTQFEDDSFDGVISFSALRYVPHPAQAVQEIYRVLRPGGVAVIDFPNKWSPWFTWLKPLITGQTHIHDHQYTTAYVKELMQKAGFQDVSARRILFTHKKIPDWTLPIMKVVDYVGEKTPGFNQIASIIMAGGRKS